MTTYVLNTPILTEWGKYEFKEIAIEQAKEILGNGFTSAIGHVGTAEVMTTLFGMEIPANRISISMKAGESAIVFRVMGRLPEGTVLTAEQVSQLNYTIGLLTRVE